MNKRIEIVLVKDVLTLTVRQDDKFNEFVVLETSKENKIFDRIVLNQDEALAVSQAIRFIVGAGTNDKTN